ncbi:MAG: sulfatase-like hydrolase/transferase [Verrucomicrobia bacterium]|nr:sulfatase-like hydrolase/transferase [Verrucomicrobiota bacterium]MDA1068847.1 sulfatase-like hydrolase/transferase [Verrucomicrobiota bacterium]
MKTLFINFLVLFAVLASAADRPNILFIMTDQHFADAMSGVMGNEYVKTPHLDALAESGVRFDRAYVPNPLCIPARNSIFTGYFPFQTGLQSNMKDPLPGHMEMMGRHFKDADYDTGYFGKWHINVNTDDKERHGFDQMGVLKNNGADHLLPEPVTNFLNQKRDKPFFLVASFTGPHDICEMVRGQKIPGGPIGEFPNPADCPPAPVNLAPPVDETDSMAMMRSSYEVTEMTPIKDFTPEKWRQMRWGYYQLIERSDREIGKVLSALNKAGLAENTLVIFTADHGDCTGAHQFAQKTVFYDEAARIPFIVSMPGTVSSGTTNKLVNVGIDTFPTMLDFAGLNIPSYFMGLSVKPVLEDPSLDSWRDYIVISNHMVQGAIPPGQTEIPLCRGRMVRTEQFKYSVYDIGNHRESLVDMENDPLEMRNLARDPSYKTVLNSHRKLLRTYSDETGDSEALEILGKL